MTCPKLWTSDGSESQEAPIVVTDVLGGGETMSMFFSDTQLGAFVFLLAMSGGLLLPSISVFGGVAGFVSFLEVVMILLPLFGCGFSFSSDGGNLLGALMDC